MFKKIAFCWTMIALGSTALPAQEAGKDLPPWTPGTLDIHHINAGKGECVFFILPDGTTLMMDAGSTHNPSPRVTDPRPDGTRSPGEWIARYIARCLPFPADKTIDVVLLSHFHGDHMGDVSDDCPLSKTGAYRLSGITDVGDRVPFKKLIDRGWPDYNYPAPLVSPMMQNYRNFIAYHQNHSALRIERFHPGRPDQIALVRQPDRYPNFEIRNVAANGEVWTGVGTNTAQVFPPLEAIPAADRPTENMCSIAIRVSYGSFDYFNGGDLVGIPEDGAPAWHDVETPVAKAVGPVDVNELNHHGFIDAENAFFLNALRPRVHVLQVWSPDHPTLRTLRRLLSTRLYPGPRDIFATNMMEANKMVIGGDLEKLKSDQGHVVVRVETGGAVYKVYVLDDAYESRAIRSVHGPYASR